MSMKLIDRSISQKVLMIGVYYKHNAAGGMASVIQYYEKYFNNLQYVSTWRDKHKLIKLYYAVLAYLVVLYKLIFCKKIRIVHIHTAADNSFFRKSIFIRLSKRFNKKVIIHIHGSRFKDYFNESKSKDRILGTLQSVDKVVVLSQSWKKWFISIGLNPLNIIVLNNIVEYPSFKELDDNSNKIKLLF